MSDRIGAGLRPRLEAVGDPGTLRLDAGAIGAPMQATVDEARPAEGWQNGGTTAADTGPEEQR